MPACPACGHPDRPTEGPCPGCGATGTGDPVTEPLGHRRTQTAPSAPDIGPGYVLEERFNLGRYLGEGAFGIVFLATDSTDGGEVAVKILRAGRLLPGMDPARTKDRFLRGAKALARLKGHPNIVSIIHVGEDRGIPYYAMEFLSDGSLLDLIRERPLTAARATTVAADVAAALVEVHAHEMIHRDLKPANIFMRQSRAVLGDFDIALVEDWTRITTNPDRGTPGTPAYMAPETWRPDTKIDHRADLFSLGCVLYEALTGKLLFEARNQYEIMGRITDPSEVDLRHLEGTLPDPLLAILKTCLAKKPGSRHATAAELESDLRSFLNETRLVERRGRRRKIRHALGWSTAAVAVVASAAWVAAAMGWIWGGGENPSGSASANTAVESTGTTVGGHEDEGTAGAGNEGDDGKQASSGDPAPSGKGETAAGGAGGQGDVGTGSSELGDKSSTGPQSAAELLAAGSEKAGQASRATGGTRASLFLESTDLLSAATEADPSLAGAWFQLGFARKEMSERLSLNEAAVSDVFAARGIAWTSDARRSLCLTGVEAIVKSCDLGYEHQFCGSMRHLLTCE